MASTRRKREHDKPLGTTLYKRMRWLVLCRDRFECQLHGATCTRVATEVDHIIAREDGGDVYDPANMRASCRRCNVARGNRRRGYNVAVPTYETRL